MIDGHGRNGYPSSWFQETAVKSDRRKGAQGTNRLNRSFMIISCSLSLGGFVIFIDDSLVDGGLLFFPF